MNKWLRGGAALGFAAAGILALAGPGSAQGAPLQAEVTTPTITPLEHAQFQSIDPCFDPTVTDMDVPGRLEVDLALGEETVFSFPETVEADGHWAIEVFRQFDDGTPAPLEVGDYRLAVHCLPADANVMEPVQNYEPLSFSVVDDAPPPAPAPAPEPEPAPPVVDEPEFTG